MFAGCCCVDNLRELQSSKNDIPRRIITDIKFFAFEASHIVGYFFRFCRLLSPRERISSIVSSAFRVASSVIVRVKRKGHPSGRPELRSNMILVKLLSRLSRGLLRLRKPRRGVEFCCWLDGRRDSFRVYRRRRRASFGVSRRVAPELLISVAAGYWRKACAEFAGDYAPLLVFVVLEGVA